MSPTAWITIGSTLLLSGMVIGPLLSVPQYSSLTHTTSQLAGQSMPGAWIMRAGFAGYGLGIWSAALVGTRLATPVRCLSALFGLLLVAVALASDAPITGGLGYDPFEVQIHSVLATAMGFAFAATVGTRMLMVGRSLIDWLALAASVVLPLGMLWLPDIAGLLQRVMFLISIAWFLHAFAGRTQAFAS